MLHLPCSPIPLPRSSCSRDAAIAPTDPAGSGLVPRARLVRQLVTSDAPIALVVAPAGYGKSTLISEWETRDERPFRWLSSAAEAIAAVELGVRSGAAQVLVVDDAQGISPEAMHRSAQPGLPAAAPQRARAGDPHAPARPRTTACPPHAPRAGHHRPGAEPARSRDAGRCRRPEAGPPPARAAARPDRRLAGDGVSGHHGPRRERRPGRGDRRVQRSRPDRGRVHP